MKNKFFVLVSLPLVILASACGKSEDQPATTATAAPVGVTCPAGQTNYNNTCVNSQYGSQPPGYTGGGYTQPPPGYNGNCSGNTYNNGYSYNNNCWGGGYQYHYWYYYGGTVWYW